MVAAGSSETGQTQTPSVPARKTVLRTTAALVSIRKHGDVYRTVLCQLILPFKFSRPIDVANGDAHTIDVKRNAKLDICHQRLSIYAMAITEGVAVEEDVARDCPPSIP